jgi:hypothetical protein
LKQHYRFGTKLLENKNKTLAMVEQKKKQIFVFVKEIKVEKERKILAKAKN